MQYYKAFYTFTVIHRVVLIDLRVPALKLLSPTQTKKYKELKKSHIWHCVFL